MYLGLAFLPLGRLFGGLNLAWYERPEALCTHRPQMRSSSTASGTCSSTTFATASPFFASTSSSFLACSTVRGKPSRMNPEAQSGSLMRSAMMPHTMSSVTSAPASIAALACLPTGVPAATAARSMSPVDSCGVPSLASILGACVPLPAPGGPNKIMILRASEPAADFLGALDFLTRPWEPPALEATCAAAAAPAATTATTLNF
mmetsp:Transcript_5933/g.25231  ORF Transcript_5933/g.25231 Transcript_5933/m.25231 type:complete len:204 (+) Transcript_5933:183-794(+)